MERGKDHFKKTSWWKEKKDCLKFFGTMMHFSQCESRNDNMSPFTPLKFKTEQTFVKYGFIQFFF